MKHRISAAAAFACLLFLSVGTARADGTSLLAYTMTGPVDATFELPVNFTVPSGDYALGVGFNVTPIDLTIDGSPAPGDFLVFYNSAADGAFGDADGLFSLTGPQLYSGPENTPTMSDIPGNIPLFDFSTGAGGYTLTMKAVPTPEPSSIILMGAGLLTLLLKRRLRVAS